MRDLGEIIGPAEATYSTRFNRTLLDGLMFQGDPAADEATLALHEQSYDPDGSQVENLRALARDRDPRAREFFERAEHRPSWVREDLIRQGQSVGLAFAHHYGISLMHSLFAGAIFGRATLVTNSTGRLGSNPERRIQETGAFIAAILQPGGLDPGSLGFETAVRVRLLHGSIRSWLKRSPGFSEQYVGEPLDQTMLAMTLSLFNYLNLRSLYRLGLPLSEEDLRAHHHLWRYIGYLLGIDEILLTETLEEERDLWNALVAHQAFPELFGPTYLDVAVLTVGAIAQGGSTHQNFIRSVFLHLSGGEWFGVEEGLLPDPLLAMFRMGSFAVGTARQWVPGISQWMEADGASRLNQATQLAREHKFGVKLEGEETADERESLFRALSDGVRTRFPDAA